MKKLIIFSVIFSAFLVGCSNFNDIETVGINNSNNSESNVLRTQFKNALENNAVSFSRSASSGTECNSEVLEVAEDTSTSDFLLENELISSVAAAYISKVENIINDEAARSIGSWFRKKAKNICCAAISGAIGAVSVGVSSAVAGWKAGGISIKVSWSK